MVRSRVVTGRPFLMVMSSGNVAIQCRVSARCVCFLRAQRISDVVKPRRRSVGGNKTNGMLGKPFVGSLVAIGHQPCRAKCFMLVSGGSCVSVGAIRDPDETAGLAQTGDSHPADMITQKRVCAEVTRPHWIRQPR